MKATRIIAEAVILLLMTASPIWATADVLVLEMPEAFFPDGLTVHAVRCGIENGYPNNKYAIKGTFSPGDLPYYGVNYNPESMQWVGQKEAWDDVQRRVTTDADGKWSGWIWLRLESSVPKGALKFRFCVVPMEPVSNPGPTVSGWHDTRTLSISLSGNAGWIAGHAWSDTARTDPLDGAVIIALSSDNRVLAAGPSQNSYIQDGEDHSDHGYFRLPVRTGSVAYLQARKATNNFYVPVFYQKPGPWTVQSGRQTLVDTTLWGDVDGDTIFRRTDALAGLRMASGLVAGNLNTATRGDVDPEEGDGVVSLADAAVLLRRLAGL